MAFILAKDNIMYVSDEENVKEIMIKGASFCQVDKIRAAIQEIEVITDGYHM